MKPYTKYIFVVIALIVVFLLGRSCNNDSKPQETTVKTVTTYRDTIFPKDTVYAFKDRPVPYPIYIDTNSYKPKSLDSLELYRFFVYKDSTEDSNIKIYSKITTQGKTLAEFKPSYKLKVPLIIKDSTVIRMDSLVYRPDKYEIHAGILASPKLIAPKIELSIDRSSYGLGYDFINKTPIIEYKFKLISWSPKKKRK